MKRQVFVRVVRDVLVGLEQLHDGVRAVHRDISFHNIMMRPTEDSSSLAAQTGFRFMDAVLIDCDLAIPTREAVCRNRETWNTRIRCAWLQG